MATAEKHRNRSCYSYHKNVPPYSMFAKKAYRNQSAARSRNIIAEAIAMLAMLFGGHRRKAKKGD